MAAEAAHTSGSPLDRRRRFPCHRRGRGSAQFGGHIEQFAKPTFERLRRTRHAAQYFDPSAPPIGVADAEWALEKGSGAVAGVKKLLAVDPPDRFNLD